MDPLNGIADTWTVDALPVDWVDVRDRWSAWHLARTALAVAAFACVLASLVIAPDSRRDTAVPGPSDAGQPRQARATSGEAR